MASFFRTMARATGLGLPKINANVNSDGMFVRGAYTPENKTRKNSRYDEIQGKIHDLPRGPSLIEFISATRSAYEALGRVRKGEHKKDAASLAKRFHSTLNASIEMSDVTDGYKRELKAYNNFLHDFFKGEHAGPTATDRAAMDILVQQSEILSVMSGKAAAIIGNSETPEHSRAVNELMARTAALASIQTAHKLPNVPTGMPGGARTRKNRSKKRT
jgi:hypothetical protein